MGEAGWKCVGEVGSRGGRLRGACAGRVRGLYWKLGWEACVGRVCGAISVGIARSALLSGYLGKSGHLPRFYQRFNTKDLRLQKKCRI